MGGPQEPCPRAAASPPPRLRGRGRAWTRGRSGPLPPLYSLRRSARKQRKTLLGAEKSQQSGPPREGRPGALPGFRFCPPARGGGAVGVGGGVRGAQGPARPRGAQEGAGGLRPRAGLTHCGPGRGGAVGGAIGEGRGEQGRGRQGGANGVGGAIGEGAGRPGEGWGYAGRGGRGFDYEAGGGADRTNWVPGWTGPVAGGGAGRGGREAGTWAGPGAETPAEAGSRAGRTPAGRTPAGRAGARRRRARGRRKDWASPASEC